jgi:hypothetical protein
MLLELGIDYKALLVALRVEGDLSGVPERRTTVLVRRAEKRRLDVWQLAPLSAALLRLCDGTRTLATVVQAFTTLGELDFQIPPTQACLFGLCHLREQGFVTFSATPRTQIAAETPLVEPLPLALGPTTTQQPWPPAVR